VRENLWAHGRREWGMGLSTHQGPVTYMQASMGFVVDVRVVFGVVVGPVLGACIPVITNWSWDVRQWSHQNCISIIFNLRGTIVLLVTPAAVELSIWIGLLGWGQPMAIRVWWWGIISCAVMNSAASSDLAAKANLMIWAIDRLAPLNQGNESSSKR
jgi:hypothetical protein